MKKAPTSSFLYPFCDLRCPEKSLCLASCFSETTTPEQSSFAIRRHCKYPLFCCRRKVSAPLGCSSQSSRLQSLFRASGHKRYNTLDFPAENRVPSGTLFPYGTPCQQAASRTYWMTRSRKESAALLWKPPGVFFADCVYKPKISSEISGSEKDTVFSLWK